MVAARAEMIRQASRYGRSIYKPFFDYMEREIRSAENKYLFSTLIEEALPGQFSLYDLDALVFRKHSYVPLAAFELKFISWRVAKESWAKGELLVNGWQFQRLRALSEVLALPLYYFVQVGQERFVMFNVANVEPAFEYRRGGSARDYYAVINLEDVIVSSSFEEFVDDISLLLGVKSKAAQVVPAYAVGGRG